MSASKTNKLGSIRKVGRRHEGKGVTDTYQFVNGKAEHIFHGHRFHSNARLETSCHHMEVTGLVARSQ